MKALGYLAAALVFAYVCLAGYKEALNAPKLVAFSPGKPTIDQDELANLKPSKDPTWEEIYAYELSIRTLYNSRRFPELEKAVGELRNNPSWIGDGRRKILVFYESLACREEEPESMWELHQKIHQEWVTAFPDSAAALEAQAIFYSDYAWHARGNDFANMVTPTGWKLFGQRLDEAYDILRRAYTMPDKDAAWYSAMMRVALGKSWPKKDYDQLVAEANSIFPQSWDFDCSRAYSLLPRWLGKPGDWQAYAQAASERPGGLGAEVYARIVIQICNGFEDVRDPAISWPKTLEGFAVLRSKYPDSLAILSSIAMLTSARGDREHAKEAFAALHGAYLPDVWTSPEYYLECRHWAEANRQ